MKTRLIRTPRRDEGMTLLELVLAAAILLIAVTAVLALIIKSTEMSVQAKQRNIITSTANSYMEAVRAMPYDSIGVSGGSVVGSLPVNTSLTVSGFSVAVTPTVQWVDDPGIPGTQDYKRLTITITVYAGNVAPITRTVETLIRRPDEMGETHLEPTIEFTDPSPYPGQGVRGIYVPIHVHAEVTDPGAELEKIQMFCDTPVLRGSGGGIGDLSTAEWANVGGATADRGFYWDTTSVNASTGVAFFPDGTRTLRIVVYDSKGGMSFKTRQVIVDNFTPTKPGPPLVAGLDSATSTRLTWGAATDGTDPAHHYVVHWWLEVPGATAPAEFWSSGTRWTDLGDTGDGDNAPTTNSYTMTTQPFSRYWIRVEAKSALYPYLNSGMTDMVTPFVSRPQIAGTSNNTLTTSTQGKITGTLSNTITLPGPTFSTSSTRMYQLYKSKNADMSGATMTLPTTWGTDGGATFVDSWTVSNKAPADQQYYYQVKAVITPTGWKGGTAVTVWSNVIGPNSAANGTATIPQSGWTSTLVTP